MRTPTVAAGPRSPRTTVTLVSRACRRPGWRRGTKTRNSRHRLDELRLLRRARFRLPPPRRRRRRRAAVGLAPPTPRAALLEAALGRARGPGDAPGSLVLPAAADAARSGRPAPPPATTGARLQTPDGRRRRARVAPDAAARRLRPADGGAVEAGRRGRGPAGAARAWRRLAAIAGRRCGTGAAAAATRPDLGAAPGRPPRAPPRGGGGLLRRGCGPSASPRRLSAVLCRHRRDVDLRDFRPRGFCRFTVPPPAAEPRPGGGRHRASLLAAATRPSSVEGRTHTSKPDAIAGDSRPCCLSLDIQQGVARCCQEKTHAGCPNALEHGRHQSSTEAAESTFQPLSLGAGDAVTAGRRHTTTFRPNSCSCLLDDAPRSFTVSREIAVSADGRTDTFGPTSRGAGVRGRVRRRRPRQEHRTPCWRCRRAACPRSSARRAAGIIDDADEPLGARGAVAPPRPRAAAALYAAHRAGSGGRPPRAKPRPDGPTPTPPPPKAVAGARARRRRRRPRGDRRPRRRKQAEAGAGDRSEPGAVKRSLRKGILFVALQRPPEARPRAATAPRRASAGRASPRRRCSLRDIDAVRMASRWTRRALRSPWRGRHPAADGRRAHDHEARLSVSWGPTPTRVRLRALRRDALRRVRSWSVIKGRSATSRVRPPQQSFSFGFCRRAQGVSPRLRPRAGNSIAFSVIREPTTAPEVNL